MSTDNRHRAGIVFKCRKCGNRGEPELRIADGVRNPRKREWGGETHAWARATAYHVRCRECGHLWWSTLAYVRRLALQLRMRAMHGNTQPVIDP
jgi:uncharacterized Zn finger protein